MKLKEHRNRMTVREAAELLGTTEQSIRVGIQTGALDIGYCIKRSSQYMYIIPTEKFAQETRITERIQECNK
ncbi:MAG: hypothetical protein Q4B26_10980 [Eubacteriales bacterium]|nr:hypothetical protein [Eubacteriales bacterium]